LVDDKLVDSLYISEGLKGLVTTQVSVSGSGEGATREEAIENTLANMNRLQTILITGSLPFKLEIEKLDTISSAFGEKLTKNILITALVAFLAISLFIFIRYRTMKIVLPILITLVSEIIIILGVASLIKWNLDLASIAGIIGAIGTGVDDQIVILDEIRFSKSYGWKERMKRAFFIILGAYGTVTVAMLPLAWAGAGLLKGFAITTIIGITAGVFITRPAFSEIIRKLIRD
ncbi:MAG: protein translocase subunit SecD, partial [Nanoarchaeota archaeon]|nr:protein translocase subunit SecD [Nanoarchaeota archaeon]